MDKQLVKALCKPNTLIKRASAGIDSLKRDRKNPVLSIIIISKNEEECLPKLLTTINMQDYTGPFEVILSDVSTDATPKIARESGCRVVKGGLPSIGRNNGAQAARGDIYLFLDSDVLMPKTFLRKNIAEFIRRKISVAATNNVPRSKKKIDKAIWTVSNYFIKSLEKVSPHANGFCIFCDATAFAKVNGFDESVVMWEDSDFVRRAAKVGKFRVLESVPIYCDVRRFEREGRAKSIAKFFYISFYKAFSGDKKTSPVNYDMQGTNMKHMGVKPKKRKLIDKMNEKISNSETIRKILKKK